jgi:hypothetical protein
MKAEDFIVPMMDVAKHMLIGICCLPENGHNGPWKIYASILRDLADKIETSQFTTDACIEKINEFQALARACMTELEEIKP